MFCSGSEIGYQWWRKRIQEDQNPCLIHNTLLVFLVGKMHRLQWYLVIEIQGKLQIVKGDMAVWRTLGELTAIIPQLLHFVTLKLIDSRGQSHLPSCWDFPQSESCSACPIPWHKGSGFYFIFNSFLLGRRSFPLLGHFLLCSQVGFEMPPRYRPPIWELWNQGLVQAVSSFIHHSIHLFHDFLNVS